MIEVAKLSASRSLARYAGRGREWRTLPEVFGTLHEEFDFTLDPCCTQSSALCKRFFTEIENGLEQSWRGHRVFMNPPYGKEISAWTRKAVKEIRDGNCPLVVALLPSSTELRWWHEDVLAEKAKLRWIRGRVDFIREDGTTTHAFMPSVIVIWQHNAS